MWRIPSLRIYWRETLDSVLTFANSTDSYLYIMKLKTTDRDSVSQFRKVMLLCLKFLEKLIYDLLFHSFVSYSPKHVELHLQPSAFGNHICARLRRGVYVIYVCGLCLKRSRTVTSFAEPKLPVLDSEPLLLVVSTPGLVCLKYSITVIVFSYIFNS